MSKFSIRIALLACALAVPGMSSAFTVYDTFGAFPNANFGGSGIPNDSVAAAKQIVDGSNTITIAMNATQRYSNPPLTNNGAGVYYAGPGSNFGGASQSTTEGALWSWNYYIEVSGGGKLTDYQFNLYYDFDPAAGTALVDLGKIDVTATLNCGIPCGANPNSVLEQDSQNLMFGFLASDFPPFIDAPAGSFNPNIAGNYQFAIGVSSLAGFPLDSVAIEVEVVPVPAAVWLFGSALGLLGWMRRRAV